MDDREYKETMNKLCMRHNYHQSLIKIHRDYLVQLLQNKGENVEADSVRENMQKARIGMRNAQIEINDAQMHLENRWWEDVTTHITDGPTCNNDSCAYCRAINTMKRDCVQDSFAYFVE